VKKNVPDDVVRAIIADASGTKGFHGLPLSQLDLAKGYQAHIELINRVGQDHPEWKETFWAWQCLDEMVHTQPDAALEVIVLCIDRAMTVDELSFIAADSLEQLIADHGDRVITAIEHQAKLSVRFRCALTGVWPQGRGDGEGDVWNRVLVARSNAPDIAKISELPER
jgi:hypothetical protein